MLKAFVLSLLVSISAIAADRLGQELPLSKNTEGSPSFGVVFSYDGGVVGNSFSPRWSVFYSADLTDRQVAELPQQVKINFFDRKSGNFLIPWASAPTFDSMSIKMNQLTASAELSAILIPLQAQVAMVIADNKNRGLYNLDIGKLCVSRPALFENLTDRDLSCDRVTADDIAQSKKAFCSESETAILARVARGEITCAKATELFASKNCGQLKCQ